MLIPIKFSYQIFTSSNFIKVLEDTIGLRNWNKIKLACGDQIPVRLKKNLWLRMRLFNMGSWGNTVRARSAFALFLLFRFLGLFSMYIWVENEVVAWILLLKRFSFFWRHQILDQDLPLYLFEVLLICHFHYVIHHLLDAGVFFGTGFKICQAAIITCEFASLTSFDHTLIGKVTGILAQVKFIADDDHRYTRANIIFFWIVEIKLYLLICPLNPVTQVNKWFLGRKIENEYDPIRSL